MKLYLRNMVTVELFENALYTIGMQVPKALNYKPEVLQMTQSAEWKTVFHVASSS